MEEDPLYTDKQTNEEYTRNQSQEPEEKHRKQNHVFFSTITTLKTQEVNLRRIEDKAADSRFFGGRSVLFSLKTSCCIALISAITLTNHD